MRDKWTWREDLTPSIPNQKLYDYVLETIEKHNLKPNQPMKLKHTKSGLYKVKLTEEEVFHLRNILDRERENTNDEIEQESAPKPKDRVFSQSVSMRCSQENYERDLKEPLARMGHRKYEDKDVKLDQDCYILTIFKSRVTRKRMLSEARNGSDAVTDVDSYFIDHYSPELFLAIAAMSAGEEFYHGQWVTTKDPKKSMEFTGMSNGDKIRKIYSISGNKIYFRDGDFLGETTDTELKEFARKATLEELVEHLAPQKVDNSKPNKFEELDIMWAKIIDWANKIVEMSKK